MNYLDPHVGETCRPLVITGDLIDLALAGRFDVLVHGCNCLGVMNAGVARQIRLAFPEAHCADLKAGTGGFKLGSISWANVMAAGRPLAIVNAYTQLNISRSVKSVDYNAVRQAMALVKSQFSGLVIAYPKIGAGLGGGDWAIISEIIATELKGERHYLVQLPEDDHA